MKKNKNLGLIALLVGILVIAIVLVVMFIPKKDKNEGVSIKAGDKSETTDTADVKIKKEKKQEKEEETETDEEPQEEVVDDTIPFIGYWITPENDIFEFKDDNLATIILTDGTSINGEFTYTNNTITINYTETTVDGNKIDTNNSISILVQNEDGTLTENNNLEDSTAEVITTNKTATFEITKQPQEVTKEVPFKITMTQLTLVDKTSGKEYTLQK